MSSILTKRLELRQLTETFLTHSLEHDHTNAISACDFIVPSEWHDETRFITLRRDQYRNEPNFRSWGVWAIVDRGTREMLGHIGFHSPPDPEYLRPYTEGAVEFGFTVYPRHRGQGIATEAARTLIDWAHREMNQRRFIVSISPMNAPSLAVARKLGFVQIGSWDDPEDGIEHVFQLDT